MFFLVAAAMHMIQNMHSPPQAAWPDGHPGKGHIMEAARQTRYELLETKCRELNISCLMTAHHAGGCRNLDDESGYWGGSLSFRLGFHADAGYKRSSEALQQ